MAYRGTGSKRGLQSGRPSSRDDAGHRERDTRPRGQAPPDDDEWQPKADRPGYSGRPRNDGKSGARGYDRDGFGGQRSDFDDGKDERHFEKRDPRPYRPEERDREPRARQSHYDHDRRGDKE